MEKAVNAAIFKAITLECKVAYKGFTILNNFKTKRVIVEEVFGWFELIFLFRNTSFISLNQIFYK